MENQTKNIENQKLVFGDKYLWGESTHYLVMSRRQLAKIWKFENNKSIKEFVETCKLVVANSDKLLVDKNWRA